MASISGVQLSLTGASGSQAALTPKSGWFAYCFPRGAWASAASAGSVITFDTAAIASRFAVNNWIQVGTATANIRKVSAVGGNSIAVSGAVVTVSKDNRVFLIGNTQPTTSGGSTTYIIPATAIRHRDDDTSDLYTNSLVTSNSDGLIQFYAPFGIYDVFLQDGNRSPQGYVADLPLGVVEGISTTFASTFGATVTINANLIVNGKVTTTGIITGGAAIAAATDVSAGTDISAQNNVYAQTGDVRAIAGGGKFGASVTVGGPLGVTGSTTLGASGVVGGLSVTTGIFGVSNQPRVWLTNSSNQSSPSGTNFRLLWDTELFDVGALHSGSTSAITIVDPGFYLFVGQVEWGNLVGATGTNTPYTVTIRKNNSGVYEVAETIDIFGITNIGPKQSVSGMDLASIGDFYEITVTQLSGTTQTVTCTGGRLNTQFLAVKLF